MADWVLRIMIIRRVPVRRILIVIGFNSPGLDGMSFLGIKMFRADNNSPGSLPHQNMRLQILVRNSQEQLLNILGVTFSGPAAELFLGRHRLSSPQVIGHKKTLWSMPVHSYLNASGIRGRFREEGSVAPSKNPQQKL